LNTRQAVRSYIEQLLQGKGDNGAFLDDESLVVAGRLASNDVPHVVNFLQERFGVDFSQGFDQTDLDTIDDIVVLVATAQS
jgi:hypothetical protein